MNRMTTDSTKALTTEQAAQRYGLCSRTLCNMRCKNSGPRYYRLGRSIFYRPEDIEVWLFSSPVDTLDSRRAESVKG